MGKSIKILRESVRAFLPGAAEKNSKHGDGDKMNTIVAAIRERMNVREKEKDQLFEMIRTVFAVTPLEHTTQMETAKQG